MVSNMAALDNRFNQPFALVVNDIKTFFLLLALQTMIFSLPAK